MPYGWRTGVSVLASVLVVFTFYLQFAEEDKEEEGAERDLGQRHPGQD